MQTHQRISKFMQSRKVVRLVAKTGLATLFGLFVSGIAVGGTAQGTQMAPVTRVSPPSAVSSCPKGTHTYTSTRSESATHDGMRVKRAGGEACTPDRSTTYHPVVMKKALNAPQVQMSFMRAQAMVATSAGNRYPYGACTWYADQRYHELHGAYVPWSGNAYAWPQGANAYGWRVSSTPSVGSIIALQSGVQGAGWLGHVGIVEQVEGNGTIVASSMNWGANPWAVSRWQFHPGPGVTFISQ